MIAVTYVHLINTDVQDSMHLSFKVFSFFSLLFDMVSNGMFVLEQWYQ